MSNQPEQPVFISVRHKADYPGYLKYCQREGLEPLTLPEYAQKMTEFWREKGYSLQDRAMQNNPPGDSADG